MAKWCPQNFDALFVEMESRTAPHRGMGVRPLSDLLQRVTDLWSVVDCVPHLRLASVDADSGTRPQMLIQRFVHLPLCSGGVAVCLSSKKANKNSPSFRSSCIASNALCCPKEKRRGISGSPCSPPFALGDRVCHSRRILPHVRRWRTIEHPHEWHRLSYPFNVHQPVQHGCSRDLIVRTDGLLYVCDFELLPSPKKCQSEGPLPSPRNVCDN